MHKIKSNQLFPTWRNQLNHWHHLVSGTKVLSTKAPPAFSWWNHSVEVAPTESTVELILFYAGFLTPIKDPT